MSSIELDSPVAPKGINWLIKIEVSESNSRAVGSVDVSVGGPSGKIYSSLSWHVFGDTIRKSGWQAGTATAAAVTKNRKRSER